MGAVAKVFAILWLLFLIGSNISMILFSAIMMPLFAIIPGFDFIMGLGIAGILVVGNFIGVVIFIILAYFGWRK